MSTLKTLTDAENTALTNVAALNGVTIVVEDDADLTTEIAKALGTLGMLVMIGLPSFHNEVTFAPVITAKIDQQILISEVPSLWRDANDDKPHGSVVAQMVAQSLHGLRVAEFQQLRCKTGEPHGSGLLKLNDGSHVTFQMYIVTLETRMDLKPL